MDVANVMGSRPDGWWRDRAGAAVRLHADLARLAASGQPVLSADPNPPEFVMVLEGAARAAAARIEPAERVRVVVADGSGDDAIVALVRELPGRLVVVTADRELRRRSAAAGADQGPGLAARPAASQVIGPPGPFNRAAPLSLSRRTEARASIVAGSAPFFPTYRIPRFGKSRRRALLGCAIR